VRAPPGPSPARCGLPAPAWRTVSPNEIEQGEARAADVDVFRVQVEADSVGCRGDRQHSTPQTFVSIVIH
jgi:hypothetical protein